MAPATPPRIGAPQLPAIYAKLFVGGTTWTFAATAEHGYDDGNGFQQEKQDGIVTCTITTVRKIRDGRVAELACGGGDDDVADAIHLPDSPNGTFVGTAKGLWRVDDTFHDDISTLDPEQMLIAATPVAYELETKDPGDDRFGRTRSVVAQPDGSWCINESSWGGDEGGWSLCLRAGVGLVGGTSFFGGGSTRDVYFGESVRD
jgi:hypothetical protein